MTVAARDSVLATTDVVFSRVMLPVPRSVQTVRICRSPGLLLVVACVIASVAMSDAASARSWLAGGHATPVQFAQHQLYESMGIHDHHGRESDAIADDAESGTVVAAAPIFTVAMPWGAADPGQLARDSRDAVTAVAPALTTLARLSPSNDPQPVSPDFLVFDPPPRVAA